MIIYGKSHDNLQLLLVTQKSILINEYIFYTFYPRIDFIRPSSIVLK